MRVQDTELSGVKLITPEDEFTDHRGSYLELYDSEKYREACAGIDWVQDDISTSKKGVLRGLHGDFETTKLVTILHGRGYCLLADNRQDSPSYRQWQAFELNRQNRLQLLIPKGIGNSVLALSEELIYFYKQDTHFVPGRQFTIRWDDPDWGFRWPIEDPILSERDKRGCYA